MYDLMRKSIQATTAMQQNQEMECLAETAKSGKDTKGLVGQAHLLYRNTPRSSSARDISAGKKQQPTTSSSSSSKSESKQKKRPKESRSGGISSNTANHKTGNATELDANTPPWDVTSEESEANATTSLRCPTRLLIRRRSLRIVEEGGGTHIYAIRYPEDTSKTILSEQAQPLSPVVRQEQCPPRNTQRVSSGVDTNNAHSTSTTSQKSSTVTSKATDKAKKTKSNQPNDSGDNTDQKDGDDAKRKSDTASKPLTTTSLISDIPAFLTKADNAGEIFSAACMTSPPKRNGRLERR